MSFVQIEFLWFFALVLGLYWALRNRRLQSVLLLVASATFYGWIHPWFLILLYASALLDFTMGHAMRRFPDKKKLFLVISMCGNLGMLGYFKYFDFFIENVVAIFGTLGVHTNLSTLGIFLPVGISFYTFQTMSYTIDVYRGELEPRRDLLDYLVFVSFFPQLVAGPVERAINLLPQIERPRSFRFANLRDGFALAMWGAFKKMVVADTIAPYVDKVFIHTDPSAAMIWAATLGFTVQVMADFSGYTDIARGTARMMGFELMENFKFSLWSASPSEFWARQHISFSTWIRDYLYIPLGGSRGGFWRMTRATFIAMVLSAVWHGASWTFVIWGLFWATLLTSYRVITRPIPRPIRKDRRWRVITVPIMFTFIVIQFIIFRETHIHRLLHYFTLGPLGGSHEQWVAATVMFAMALALGAFLMIGSLAQMFVIPRLRQSGWYLPALTTMCTVCGIAMYIFQRTTTNDFIYFQF
ncbi:MAG: MBOAT family protein [Armatimonadetes bacterium]|nr:MBOAT family protein [Armatimonadota bacterium]